MPDLSRHTASSVIEYYVESGTRGVLAIPGVPELRVVIDPPRRSLALQAHEYKRVPNVAHLRNVLVDEINDGSTWCQVAISFDGNVSDLYAFFCGIADRVQLGHEDFAAAVDSALDSMAGILAARRGLSHERQVGLFGELAALFAITKATTAESAERSWKGPESEEHDFVLENADVEVKTTASERREHWISTATQLAPSKGRRLSLLSLQVTAAAPGTGVTLPGVVALLRAEMKASTRFEAKLKNAGYFDEDADLYASEWTLRTEPCFFDVTPMFPALTQTLIDQFVRSGDRIRELKYRLDLTGLESGDALFHFDWQLLNRSRL